MEQYADLEYNFVFVLGVSPQFSSLYEVLLWIKP